MKLTVEEIDTLFDWFVHFEYNDLLTDAQNDAIENRNEKLIQKLSKEYKRLGGNNYAYNN